MLGFWEWWWWRSRITWPLTHYTPSWSTNASTTTRRIPPRSWILHPSRKLPARTDRGLLEILFLAHRRRRGRRLLRIGPYSLTNVLWVIPSPPSALLGETHTTDAVRQNNVRQTAAAEPSYDSLAPRAASPAIKVYPIGAKAGMLVVRMVTLADFWLIRVDLSSETLRSELNSVRYELSTLQEERELERIRHEKEIRTLETKVEEQGKRADVGVFLYLAAYFGGS